MFVWRKVALRCDGRKKRFFVFVSALFSLTLVFLRAHLSLDGWAAGLGSRLMVRPECVWGDKLSSFCLPVIGALFLLGVFVFWFMLAFVFRARYVLFFYYPETCTWPTGTQVVGGELAISRSKCGFPALRHHCIWVKCVFQKVHRIADFHNSCYQNVCFCGLRRAGKWYFVDKMRQASVTYTIVLCRLEMCGTGVTLCFPDRARNVIAV